MNAPKRYFFVSYVNDDPGHHHYGNFDISTSNGLHPTMKDLTDYAHGDYQSYKDRGDVTILSCEEKSKEDIDRLFPKSSSY